MRKLFVLVVSALLVSCEKEALTVKENNKETRSTVCNVKDPINKSAWLQNRIKDFKESSFYLRQNYAMNVWVSNYNGQDLIIIYIGNELSNGASEYYTCTGQSYCDYTNKPCPDFITEIEPQAKLLATVKR